MDSETNLHQTKSSQPFSLAKFIPDLNADVTSDACHILALLLCLGMIVKLVGWGITPDTGGIELAGMLFAGGIMNSKLNGTPGQ